MRGIDPHTWMLLVIGGCLLGATFPGVIAEFAFAHLKLTSWRGFATYAWSMFIGVVGFVLVIRELAILTGLISVHHLG
jgi:hypothetical protein